MKVLFRGTRAASAATRFLTMHFTPTPYLNSADAVRVRAGGLFFELVENVSQPDIQRLGNADAGQNGRDTVMAFNETDSGTSDANFFGKGLVREALLLTEPGEFINDLFDQ